jgi:hypothetical protein
MTECRCTRGTANLAVLKQFGMKVANKNYIHHEEIRRRLNSANTCYCQ